ncbi:MAG: hypothetical protein IKJ43_02860 [Bacilli bacterium]|nr:hypothetical protein [Bacilli bacterium]
MAEDLLHVKKKQLISKREEVYKNYDLADEETKKIYDKMLELIEIELHLISNYVSETENQKTR